VNDEQRPPELIELPLEHKEESWETVDKGLDASAPRRPPTDPVQPRRRWPWVILLLVLMLVAYWIFWPNAPKIEFEVASLQWAEERVGEVSEMETAVLRNIGERPLEVSAVGVTGVDSVDFSTRSENCSGRLIEPGGECRVDLAFAPLEMGVRQAELEITANVRGQRALLPIAGEGVAPLLGSQPEKLDFGGESVGATSPALDLDLVNRGTFPLSIRSVALTGSDAEFSIVGNQCSSQTLAPAESCRLRIVFGPRLLGQRSGELVIGSDTHGEPAPIQLIGRGSGPDLEIEPAGLDFGIHLVGTTSEPRDLRLTNTGDEPFRVSSLSLPDKVGIELVDENCSRRVIAPGASCSASLRFRPRREGRVETSLLIREASGGLAPGVGFVGTGVSPRLGLSVSEVDLAGVVVGSSGAFRTVEVDNPGTATLEISEVRLIGADAAAFVKGRDGCSAVELPAGGRCSVEVQLRPRSGGDLSARLSFRSNAPGESPAVNLRGRGLVARLSPSRSRLDFAAVRQSESQDLRVEVENSGEAPLEIGRLDFEGAAAGDFGLAGNGCSARSIAPAASCRIIVRFSPTRNGLRDARLRLESNAPSGPVTLVLRGSGLDAPEPRLEVSPARLEFGPRGVGQRSEVLTLVIRSSGQGRLQIHDIRLRGDHAADFRLVAGTCQGLPYLVPGGDCSVGVRFTPGAPGERSAAVVIEHNAPDGVSQVPLSGSGL